MKKPSSLFPVSNERLSSSGARPASEPSRALVKTKASSASTQSFSAGQERPLSDSAWKAVLAGIAIIAIFFGGFGSWAFTAPLNSAVVASAVVKVEGNRKSIQHLDGGIIKTLRIKEGSKVEAGEVLIVLDDGQARAELEILTQQYLVLRATEVRLLAELAGSDNMVVPPELSTWVNDPYARDIWAGQLKQFTSRRATIAGQRSVIREKIHQLESQIVGAEAQVKSFTDQITSVRAEAENIAPLVEKQLLPRPRLLQLERSAFSLEGQIADAKASVAKFRQAIAEQQLQIAQLDNERMSEVTKDLREIQGRLLEVIPKRANAEAILGRMEIRTPYAGRVVGLAVFSVGGVIQRGEKILDIVPEQDDLAVEAQIAVEDISDVHPGMDAEVHLTAYKQRIVPTVRAEVIQVSADRLTDPKSTDPKSNNAYYVALLRLNQQDLAALPDVKLYPGMPAMVLIPTQSRTAFDYLVGPLTMSFNRAFRQK